MEHGIAAFIDSQNRVNTFVNYATTREWKTSSGRGKKEKKNWKKRKYDMAQIVSIDQWEEKRMVASTTARLSFVVGHRSFFGDTQKILQSTQTHAHIDAGRSVYIRKRDVDMQHDDTRIARMCRQTGFDIPCLCNYARPVSGRTLIELRCIMIITFDTAMLDTFRIN